MINLFILMSFPLLAAGGGNGTPEAVPAGEAFDFWVGRWNVHWFLNDTVRVDGSNFIEKTLDGKVLQEHFEDPTKNFKGTSISVFRPADSTWRQAWADNQGGYFDFIGEFDGETRIFRTHGAGGGVDSVMQRMRFYDITPDSFTWDWEGTRDGGKSWNLLWRIYYERSGEPDSSGEGGGEK